MINVVDEVLNTAQTDNKIKYVIKFDDGTSKIATIDLATPVTTAGTPLNKVLFDSIDDTIHEATESETNTQTFNQTTATTYTQTFNSTNRRYVIFTIDKSGYDWVLFFDTQTNKFIFAFSQESLLLNVSEVELEHWSSTRYIKIQSCVYNNGSITMTLKGTVSGVTENPYTITINSYELDGYKGA